MAGNIGMIHTCIIVSRTQSSQDEFGAPVYSETSASSSCRFFYNNTNSRIIDQESGKHTMSTPAVMLPATISIEEGNTITSEVTGFSKTYTVIAVKPIYYMFTETIHHYECDLEEVE
jgi:hypothetical protein